MLLVGEILVTCLMFDAISKYNKGVVVNKLQLANHISFRSDNMHISDLDAVRFLPKISGEILDMSVTVICFLSSKEIIK